MPAASVRTPNPVRHAAPCAALLPAEVLPLIVPELLPELPPVLLSPVLLWCVSFLVFPFSWRRLFFTYLIPVLPLVLLVDGFLSRMRSYTAAELEEIARGAGLPEGYRVVVEVLPVYGGAAKIHCLIARPLQNS